jgi:MFS family permease
LETALRVSGDMAGRLIDAAIPMAGSAGRDAVCTKVSWRIMLILLLCYIANFVDRTNISIAQIHMRTDLGFTDEICGIGVGLFFIGFIFFEVPSNILLERIGARRTLLRIMVTWGFVSAGTTFATTPLRFYCARILLWAAEAGFFPSVLLYLTYWYPSIRRARMTSLFFLGLPLSGFVGSVLSGWILHSFNNVYGLRGWQWMFLKVPVAGAEKELAWAPFSSFVLHYIEAD